MVQQRSTLQLAIAIVVLVSVRFAAIAIASFKVLFLNVTSVYYDDKNNDYIY